MPSTNPTFRVYTEEDKDRAFALAAVYANMARAAYEVGMPRSTLAKWIKEEPTRYEEIRARLLPKIQERMAVQAEDAAMRQAEVETDLLSRLAESIGSLSPKDAAGALRNLSTAKAINIDKAQLLRGNPTQIVEQRSAGDIAKSIAERFPHLVVDSTCEEIPEAAQLEQSVGA